MPKGDEIQIRRREHHLNPDQNENGVTPAQDRQQSDRKQRSGNDEKSLQCRCHRFSSSTSTSAPISAAVRRTPMHCSGHTEQAINTWPICFTVSARMCGGTIVNDCVLRIAHVKQPNTASEMRTPLQLKPRCSLESRRVSRMVKTISTATAPT